MLEGNGRFITEKRRQDVGYLCDLRVVNTIKSTQLCHYYIYHGGGGVGLRGPDDCPIVDLFSPSYRMRLEYKEKVKKENEVITAKLPNY